MLDKCDKLEKGIRACGVSQAKECDLWLEIWLEPALGNIYFPNHLTLHFSWLNLLSTHMFTALKQDLHYVHTIPTFSSQGAQTGSVTGTLWAVIENATMVHINDIIKCANQWIHGGNEEAENSKQQVEKFHRGSQTCHSVKVTPCLFYPPGVSACVGCLAERDSQSRPVSMCLFSCWTDDSLRCLHLISCWLTVPPWPQGVSTWVTHAHKHTHTQLRNPSDVTQPPQQLPHREENENEIKDDVWGHAVIWEEWTEQCRACVHVCPRLPDDYLEQLCSCSDIRASQWQQMTTTVTRENTRKLKVTKYTWRCVLPAAKQAQVYKDSVTSLNSKRESLYVHLKRLLQLLF